MRTGCAGVARRTCARRLVATPARSFRWNAASTTASCRASPCTTPARLQFGAAMEAFAPRLVVSSPLQFAAVSKRLRTCCVSARRGCGVPSYAWWLCLRGTAPRCVEALRVCASWL